MVDHHGCLQLLIAAGANVNKKEVCGYTPLHLAVKMNNTESVDALLEAGADVETKTDRKQHSFWPLTSTKLALCNLF